MWSCKEDFSILWLSVGVSHAFYIYLHWFLLHFEKQYLHFINWLFRMRLQLLEITTEWLLHANKCLYLLYHVGELLLLFLFEVSKEDLPLPKICKQPGSSLGGWALTWSLYQLLYGSYLFPVFHVCVKWTPKLFVKPGLEPQYGSHSCLWSINIT